MLQIDMNVLKTCFLCLMLKHQIVLIIFLGVLSFTEEFIEMLIWEETTCVLDNVFH